MTRVPSLPHQPQLEPASGNDVETWVHVSAQPQSGLQCRFYFSFQTGQLQKTFNTNSGFEKVSCSSSVGEGPQTSIEKGTFGPLAPQGAVLVALAYEERFRGVKISASQGKSLAVADGTKEDDPHLKTYLLPDSSPRGQSLMLVRRTVNLAYKDRLKNTRKQERVQQSQLTLPRIPQPCPRSLCLS
ncbi:synaptotagmin-like protein 2 isoform X2 [Notamacropus eugenii]|uniref:synaptotagmin-like protein 2 isoform X2 n=1 Tax=Notamacropus eugenii TaxID=9315 RepID=UPI003B678B21